jgi:hypothetical protein
MLKSKIHYANLTQGKCKIGWAEGQSRLGTMQLVMHWMPMLIDKGFRPQAFYESPRHL